MQHKSAVFVKVETVQRVGAGRYYGDTQTNALSLTYSHWLYFPTNTSFVLMSKQSADR